ncbi:MAG: hypothetical protein ACP5XB_24915, partial [Isosphaeraceae bacterium]
ARFLPDRPPSPLPPPAVALSVDVASTNHALRSVLAEALAEAGFQVTHGRDPRCERPLADFDPEPVVTVWDVPVLEERWPDLLWRQSRQGPVLALLGFADRQTAEKAWLAGASACLDLPVELDDLAHVVGRLAREDRRRTLDAGRIEPGHLLPPAPASRASRGLAAIRNRGESSKPSPSAVLVSATGPHPAYGHPLPQGQGEGMSSPSPSGPLRGPRCPEGG